MTVGGTLPGALVGAGLTMAGLFVQNKCCDAKAPAAESSDEVSAIN